MTQAWRYVQSCTNGLGLCNHSNILTPSELLRLESRGLWFGLNLVDKHFLCMHSLDAHLLQYCNLVNITLNLSNEGHHNLRTVSTVCT